VYLADNKNAVPVRAFIATEHPRFLVYADQGKFHDSLILPPGCGGSTQIDGVRFHCTFAGQVYRVYDLSYP
jgi:hypothetical protein